MDTHDGSRVTRLATALTAPARPPEPAARTWTIRVSALLALGVGLVYLVWRATSTLHPEAMTLSVALLLLEVHAWLGLALFTFSLWDVDGAPPIPGQLPEMSVAVLIPTYNEPAEVLLPTITAAVALEPAHRTLVLDDGKRPEIARLARRLGAEYVTRAEHVDAKAGNLNHALAQLDVELVAILDADHVAAPGFLLRTMPYFVDEGLALVQTPQDFYNEDSFEHVASRRSRQSRLLFSEQAVFYREIQPGKNRWGAAFWCGTGAVVRTAALASVGGVTTTSVTEDIQTTIRMHRRGWRTVYHDEVLARGLAAATSQQYALQRHRWCAGAMQVLRQELPLTDRRLTVPQRLAYAATLLGWFDAVRLLGLLVLPVAVLATGASPIAAPLPLFLLLFVTSLVLQQHALWRLARGRIRPVPTAVFELTRLEATLRAIAAGLFERDLRFAVTPKGRSRTDQDERRSRMPLPRLLTVLAAAHLLALAWYAGSMAGVTPMRYSIPAVAHGAAFWATVNAGLLFAAISRIRSARFADDRRASHRFPTTARGTLDGHEVTVDDLSLTGAQVTLDAAFAPADGSQAPLRLQLADGVATFACEVRSVRDAPEGPGVVRVGLAFNPGQLDQQARLALGLFHAPALGATAPTAAAPAEREETDGRQRVAS
jgi:cellulose synthase/poly-beta-1,6-N-acetylglucosamine synthase-like glycosyltransferase